jgi:hypothetical protein
MGYFAREKYKRLLLKRCSLVHVVASRNRRC